MTSGLVSGQISSPGGGVRRRCRPPPVQKRWELAGSNGSERENREGWMTAMAGSSKRETTGV